MQNEKDIAEEQLRIKQNLQDKLLMTIPCTWKNPLVGALTDVVFFENSTDIDSIIIYDVISDQEVETTDRFTEFNTDAVSGYFALKPKELHKLLKVLFELDDYDPYDEAIYKERLGPLWTKEEFLILLEEKGFLEFYKEKEPFSLGIFDFNNPKDKGRYVARYDKENFKFLVANRDRLKKQFPDGDFHIDFV